MRHLLGAVAAAGFVVAITAASPAAADGLTGVDRAQFVSQMTRACVQAQGGGQSPLGLDGPAGGFCACVSDRLAGEVTPAELSQIATTHAVPESVAGKASGATQACLSNVGGG